MNLAEAIRLGLRMIGVVRKMSKQFPEFVTFGKTAISLITGAVDAASDGVLSTAEKERSAAQAERAGKELAALIRGLPSVRTVRN